MKKLIITSLILLFSFTFSFSQIETYQALGDSVVASLVQEDYEKFEALLMPKDLFVEMIEENLPSNYPEESKELLLKTIDNNFATDIQNAFKDNFEEVISLVKKNDIPLDTLQFDETLPTVINAGKGSKVIHAELDHPTFRHFYIIALKYEGKYYIMSPMMKITEEEEVM